MPLEGETISRCLESYFSQSEQLPTRLWLASDATHAAGLLLQALPQNQDDEDEDVGHESFDSLKLSNPKSY